MDLDQISTARLKPGKPESQESAAEDIAAIKDILTALLNVLMDQDQSTTHVHNNYLDGST